MVRRKKLVGRSQHWEREILNDNKQLFGQNRKEKIIWKENIIQSYFRMFKEPNLSCVGWMDASDHELGEIIVTILDNGDGQMPVMMDNLVLDGAGVLPIVCNFAKLQVDNFPTCRQIVQDHDLDLEAVC